MMRLSNIVKFLMVGLALFFSASTASAFRTFFVNPSATVLNVGDSFTIEMHLDTQGETQTTSVFVSAFADPSVLAFDKPASSANGQILFNPSTYVGLVNAVPPTTDPGDDPGYIRAANFVTANPAGSGVSKADQPMVIIAFTAVGPGTIQILGNFDILSDTITVAQQPITAAQITMDPSVFITVVPEPGTALLMGLGLAGLGFAGRRKA